jgi:multidrug efflux pump subunit AcrA (membrane-fusion protein)
MSIFASFTPVPRQRERHDGWTEKCQRAFIEALSQHGNVSAAAKKVGKCAASAYRLRKAEGAASFNAAWEEALGIGMMRLQDIAMDRAVNGVPMPRYYKGEQVGEVRWYDNRLLMFMLRHAHPQRYGPYAADDDLARRNAAEAAACEANRLAQLERAEALLAATEAEIAELENDASSASPQDMRTTLHLLQQRRERLQSLLSQLRQVDTLREAEASLDQLAATGRFSTRHATIFKRQLQVGGP